MVSVVHYKTYGFETRDNNILKNLTLSICNLWICGLFAWNSFENIFNNSLFVNFKLFKLKLIDNYCNEFLEELNSIK